MGKQGEAGPGLGRELAGGLLMGLGWGLIVAVGDGLSLMLGGTPGAYWGERAMALAYLAVLYGVLGAALGAILGAVYYVAGRVRGGSTVGRAFARLRPASTGLDLPSAPRGPQSASGAEHTSPVGSSSTVGRALARLRPVSTGLDLPSAPRGPQSASGASRVGSFFAIANGRTGAPFVLGGLAALTAAVAWGQRFRPGPTGWVLVALLAGAAGLAAAWLVGLAVRRGRVPGRALRVMAAAVFVVALLAVTAVGLSRAAMNGGQAAGAAAAAEGADRPNILLITADGVRADRLGVYGYDPAISPNLDALAQRGVRFEQAIAPGSWGRPSAAALLTGLYPSQLGYGCTPDGGCRWPAPDLLRTTLAEALSAAGYRTAAMVASPWLNATGFRQGFNRFEAARGQEPFDDAPMRARTMGRLLGCVKGSPFCRLYRQGRERLIDERLIENTGGEAINARAARWLEQMDGEPFFLWVHYDDALPPYNLAEPLRPPAEGALASPVRRLKNLGYWELGDPFTAREELLPLDGAVLAALYDGEVQRVDRLAGELFALLEARGLAGRTVIVFAGGHGQELFEHGGYTYGHTLYDEVLRVPLIAAGPGVTAAGVTMAGAVSLVDLAPTLAEFGGAALPAEVEGQSLVPALLGRVIEERPVFSEALYRVPLGRQALRRSGYKLIAGDESAAVELYDLKADPGETRNLAAAQPDTVQAMQDELAAWQARMREVGLTLPVSPGDRDDEQRLW